MKAFTFTFKESKNGKTPSTPSSAQQLNIHMASAYYIHNPHLLSEIVLYAGDYKQYALNLAKSIQNAASDMAKSMVMKRSSSRGLTGFSPVFSDSVLHKTSLDSLKFPEQFTTSFSKSTTETPPPSKMYFTVTIETPVVVFPRDDESLEFVVGHLGKIHVSNASDSSHDNNVPSVSNSNHSNADQPDSEKLVVEIEKINLSVFHGTVGDSESNAKSDDIVNMLRRQQTHSQNQTAILHNTDLYLQIEKIFTSKLPAATDCNSSQQSTSNQHQTIKIIGQINSTLRLFLSVPIYQQILSTLRYSTNISSNVSSTPGTTTATPVLSSVSSESSLSVDDVVSTT